MSNRRYKYCIVPQCKSTTSKTPHKLFFSVPVGEKIRKEWCLAMGRIPGVHRTLSIKCTRFVCEDHFDLENDMENYIKWKLVGVGKLILKKGVLPHKFDCEKKDCDVGINNIQSDETSLKENIKCHEDDEEKDRYVKERETSFKNYINNRTHDEFDIEIKKEVVGNMYEQTQNIVTSSEAEDVDNNVYVIKYDSDTGGEYLIKLSDIKNLI